jgi:hypothetical protein
MLKNELLYFFEKIVTPTVQEFRDDPLNIRRGLLASIVLYHVVDYYVIFKNTFNSGGTELKRTEVTKELISVNPGFQHIQDVANASKHNILTLGKPLTTNSNQIARNGDGLFNAPLGEGFFLNQIEIIITLDDGVIVPLLNQVNETMVMWEAKMSTTFTEQS